MRLISLVNVPDDLCIQFSRSAEAELLVGRSAPSLYLDKGVPFWGVFFKKSLKKFFKAMSFLEKGKKIKPVYS